MKTQIGEIAVWGKAVKFDRDGVTNLGVRYELLDVGTVEVAGQLDQTDASSGTTGKANSQGDEVVFASAFACVEPFLRRGCQYTGLQVP